MRVPRIDEVLCCANQGYRDNNVRDIAELDSGFRVGTWEVQPRLGTVASAERVNRIEPRVMAVLVCLARNAPNVVTRDEFIRDVWQGRIVTDEVLSRCISLLRTAFDDQAREPRIVQTLPRIGYRLLVAVEPLARAPAPVVDPVSPEPVPVAPGTRVRARLPTSLAPQGSRRLLLVIATFSVVAAFPYLLWDVWSPPQAPALSATESDRTSIAVLPFADRSDAADRAYFSDGLTEEIIARLSTIKGLDVVASSPAFSFKDRTADVRSIGRKLGVAYIVEGNVRRDGERVRITARLIDARSSYQLLSRIYEGHLSDIFTLQDEVAGGIVDQLATALPGIGVAPPGPATPPTGNIAAYELVLRGRHQFRIREEANIRRSIELFEQAIALDPGYADAYADLARAQVVLPSYSTEDEEKMFATAQDTLQQGATFDPQILEESQDVVGFIEHARWHWRAAQDAFGRALKLRPRDSNLLQWYSQFLASVGRTRESLRYAQMAKEIDVISPVVNDRLAVAYMWNDQDALAASQFEVSRELGIRIAAQPEAYLLLLLRLGRYAEARMLVLALQGPGAPPPGWLEPFLAALTDTQQRPAAVQALARAEREHAIPRRYAVGAWMHLGEDGRALDAMLDLMKNRREFEVELLFSREARGVRRHPRFGEVLESMGLVDYWDATGWPDVCKRVGGEIRCE